MSTLPGRSLVDVRPSLPRFRAALHAVKACLVVPPAAVMATDAIGQATFRLDSP